MAKEESPEIGPPMVRASALKAAPRSPFTRQRNDRHVVDAEGFSELTSLIV